MRMLLLLLVLLLATLTTGQQYLAPDRNLLHVSRATQLVDEVCKVIIASGTLFPSCVCGPDGDTDIGLTCNDFCELCLDDDASTTDVCVTFSYFVRYSFFNASRIYASFFRFQEHQTGVDSSNSLLIRERTFDGELNAIACNTTINDQVCNSCQVNPACGNEGFIHNCTNVLGIDSVVNTCSANNIINLSLDNPFVVLNSNLFDTTQCREAEEPAPSAMPSAVPVSTIPPKKTPPQEDSNKGKLFRSEFDAGRGNLKRRLRSKGA